MTRESGTALASTRGGRRSSGVAGGGGGPPVFVSGAYTTNSTFTLAQITATVPAGPVAGNLLVAVVYAASPGSVVVSAPTGWALAPSGASTQAGSPGSMYVFTRVASGSEPGTYIFPAAPSGLLCAALAQFSGTPGADGACAFNPVAVATTAAAAPSVTPGAGHTADAWLTAYGSANGSTFSTPAGATLAAGNSSAGFESLYLFYVILSSAAATGTQASTQAPTSQYNSVSALLLP